MASEIKLKTVDLSAAEGPGDAAQEVCLQVRLKVADEVNPVGVISVAATGGDNTRVRERTAEHLGVVIHNFSISPKIYVTHPPISQRQEQII